MGDRARHLDGARRRHPVGQGRQEREARRRARRDHLELSLRWPGRRPRPPGSLDLFAEAHQQVTSLVVRVPGESELSSCAPTTV
ncbi:hypothetical protein AERO9AM_11077 [Aeromicrobium sp. 9AM]|nr:hypothetical protein AERO9AM_11077 [Aeromicrobium sp. 9AM]